MRFLYQLSHKGSPRILECVAYPFSRDLRDPGIKPGPPTLQVAKLWYEKRQVVESGVESRKYDLIQVTKVHISNHNFRLTVWTLDTGGWNGHFDGMDPWYKEMKLTPYDLHPNSPKLNLVMDKNQTNSNRQTSYKMPDHFKTVHVIKTRRILEIVTAKKSLRRQDLSV